MSEPGLQPIRTHTSTEQWKSFEVRMRQRRAERCLARGLAACELRAFDEARAHLEEARRLDADLPGLAQLEQRLATSPPPVAPPAVTPKRRARWVAVAAGSAGLFLTGGGAFLLTSSPQPEPTPTAPPAANAPAPEARPRVSIVERFVTAPLTMATPEPERPPTLETVSADSRPAPPAAPAGLPANTQPSPPTARTVEIQAPPPAPPASPIADPSALARNTSAVPIGKPPATPALPESRQALPPIRDTIIPATRPAPEPETPAASAEPEVDDVARVRAVLSRYEAAYSGLDAAAARAVWPAVDERALARAFNNLQSQRVSLNQCDVSVSGASARAECDGSATWVPKVGGSGRTESRRWLFDLRQASGAWQIVRAEAR
jgi:hypothetical protein